VEEPRRRDGGGLASLLLALARPRGDLSKSSRAMDLAHLEMIPIARSSFPWTIATKAALSRLGARPAA